MSILFDLKQTNCLDRLIEQTLKEYRKPPEKCKQQNSDFLFRLLWKRIEKNSIRSTRTGKGKTMKKTWMDLQTYFNPKSISFQIKVFRNGIHRNTGFPGKTLKSNFSIHAENRTQNNVKKMSQFPFQNVSVFLFIDLTSRKRVPQFFLFNTMNQIISIRGTCIMPNSRMAAGQDITRAIVCLVENSVIIHTYSIRRNI